VHAENGASNLRSVWVEWDPAKERVLSSPGEDRPGREGARIAIGQTAGGRFLPVVYVPDPQRDNNFVITAYDFTGKRYWHIGVERK